VVEKYAEAWKLVGQRRHDEALQLLKQVIAEEPNYFRAYEQLVHAYNQAHRLEDAESYLKALAAERTSAGGLYGLGKLYLQQRKYQMAESALAGCLAVQPTVLRCVDRFLESALITRKRRLGLTEFLKYADLPGWRGCYPRFRYFHLTGAHAKALPIAHECLAQAESHDDSEVQLEIRGYLAGYYWETGTGYETALAHSARLVELAAQIGDPEDLIHARTAPSYPLLVLGRDHEAEKILSDCLREVEGLGHRRWEVKIQSRLAFLALEKGDFQVALERFHAVQKLQHEHREEFNAAVTGLQIAKAYHALGLFAEARRAFDASGRVFEQGVGMPWESEQAWTSQYLARVHRDEGDYLRAIQSGFDAIRLHRGLGMEWQAGMAIAELAESYEAPGDYQAAIRYTREALRIAVARMDRAGEQLCLARLGALLLKTGRAAEALTPLHRALRLNVETKQPSQEASIRLSLGDAYRQAGQMQSGLGQLRSALSIAERFGLSRQQAEAHYRLGKSLLLAGNRPEARRSLEAALAIAGRTDNGALSSRAQWQLARLHRLDGRLKEALTRIQAAISIVEERRNTVPTPELKTSYQEQNAALYEEAVTIASLLHERAPQASHDEAALVFAEQGRARSLYDVLLEPASRFLDRLSPAERQQRARLEIRWSKAVTASERSPSPQSRAAAEAAERDLADWWTRMRLAHPSKREGISAASVAEALRRVRRNRDAVIVEYALSEVRSVAWVVAAGEIRMVTLPPRERVAALVGAYRREVARHPAAQNAAAYRTPAAALYRALIEPVAPDLARGKRLIVIPDGELHYLPFEALLAPRSNRFLVEDHVVSYAPSIATLVELGDMPPPNGPHELLAYGDPEYGQPGVEATPATLVRSLYRNAGFRFSRLPNTRREVETIARHFDPARRRVRLGAEATEASLKADRLADYRRIHLAAHAAVDERLPTRSGVVLTLKHPGPSTEDGVLRLEEIAALHLNADLVVLSACQTGLGAHRKGEGLFGLSRAFLQAGARRVVMTLWEVNDAATADLMNDLYGHLASGLPAAAALREAKLSMLRSKRLAYRHPYYWAPFALTGLP
jgi:CHAT domain-containing protein/lipopolysaccharide biosynthesis regulator YciM